MSAEARKAFVNGIGTSLCIMKNAELLMFVHISGLWNFMLPTVAEALLKYASKSQIMYGENAAEMGDMVRNVFHFKPTP